VDQDTIGFKKPKTIEKMEWICCPDYKTKRDGKNCFQRFFLNRNEYARCIHGDVCENWEYSELKDGCVAGYWNKYSVSVVNKDV